MSKHYYVLKCKNLCPHSRGIIAEEFFHLKDARRWYKAINGDALVEATFIIKFKPPKKAGEGE